MRQVGGYAHCGFKDLTTEQKDAPENPSSNPKIRHKQGTDRLRGGGFEKSRVEVRYIDEIGADMFFCSPTTGRLPASKRELATDTWVLDQLGVPHKSESRSPYLSPFTGRPEKRPSP